MNRDPQLLMSIQIALMGIVLIVGFFFIWRTLSRLESRIDEISCQVVNNACLSNNSCPLSMSLSEMPSIYKNATCPVTKNGENGENGEDGDDGYDENDDEEYDDDDEDFSIMKACFNDIDIPIKSLIDDQGTSFMIFNATVMKEEDNEGVLLEEITEHDHKTTNKNVTVKNIEKQKDDASSIAETDANELSKNKLKKMNVDALRELCVARGLATDGIKAALIDRILASIPSA